MTSGADMKQQRRPVLMLLAICCALLLAACGDDAADDTAPSADPAAPEQVPADDEVFPDATPAPSAVGGDEVKAAHFVSSDPAHGDVVASGQVQVVQLDFDFDLATGSEVQVTHGGSDATTGPTRIEGDDLVLSVPVDATSPGGYEVSYTACWPDGSCHEGSFGFDVAGG